MKITDFKDIGKFPTCGYRVDVSWTYLEQHIEDGLETGLDLDPDFQRAHVWTEKQQSQYCEYILRNGPSGRELYFNCKGWLSNFSGPYVIVDGKQRLEAVRKFMRGELKVFGSYLGEYKNKPDLIVARFSWNIASIENKNDVLKWYLDFNSGGTIHKESELQKVRDMIGQTA